MKKKSLNSDNEKTWSELKGKIRDAQESEKNNSNTLVVKLEEMFKKKNIASPLRNLHSR